MDDSRNERRCCFSALAIPSEHWHTAYEMIRGYRVNLKTSDGIFVKKELHCLDFVSGRGRIAKRIVPKARRVAIFFEILQMVSQIPGARLVNAALSKDRDDWAFERLLNRIQRMVEVDGKQAILICDEGKNAEYTRLRRKMGVYNPIPSYFGAWPGGATTKNIPISRIVEDPVFVDSRTSYFIQLVDFCAYALLRKEEPFPPGHKRAKYGLERGFNLLDPILNKQAHRKDPYGIIR